MNGINKHALKFFSTMMITALLLIGGCSNKSDPAPDVKAVQLSKLSRTWKITEVKLNGIVQSGYSDFTLTLSGDTRNKVFNYSTTGRPDNSPWPGNGLWIFGTTIEATILRDDALEMEYSVTDQQLQLSFHFTGQGFQGGRRTSVEGAWVFKFSSI